MSNAEIQFNRAQALFEGGNYAAALQVLESLGAAYPGQRNILFAQARCCERMGDLERAKSLCEACMRLDPSARVQEMLNRLSQANDAAERLGISEFQFDDPVEGSPSAFSQPPIRVRESLRIPFRQVAIVAAGILLVALGGLASWRIIQVSERDTETRDDFQSALEQKLKGIY